MQAYEENTTTKDINKFKVYVTDSEYFEADLPPLSITNTSNKNYKKNPYLVAIMAAFVSTYICGISTKHLEFNKNTPGIITSTVRYHLYYQEFNKNTPGIITSTVRYHLYYQISKFLKDSSKLAKYFTHFSYSFYENMSPTTDVWTDVFAQGHEEINTWLSEQKDKSKIRNYKYSENNRGEVTGISYQKITGQTPNDVKDYEKFIATKTDGLTKIGQRLLQQSIESYVYAVRGVQAKTRWSIIGEGAKSLQTQEVFHKIVKETIVQSDTTITISNMRTAIANTNAILNMAISPGMILVPSNLIIQREKIPGYNNVLTLGTDKMKFGKNTEVNYKAPRTTTQVTPKSTQVTPNKTIQVTPKTTTTQVKIPKISVASEILGITMMIGGFLFSKYIF